MKSSGVKPIMIERILALLVACAVVSACGLREDPARGELRQRLRQGAQLSNEELGRFRAEIGRAMAGKTLFKQGSVPEDLDAEQRELIFDMLAGPPGLFDEGLKTLGEKTFRVLNAPARSTDAEVEAFRRLWIDVDTFVPRQFELAHAVVGYEQYTIDLVVGPKK
jgi:hypothetical protein